MKKLVLIFLLTPFLSLAQISYLPVPVSGESYFLSVKTDIGPELNTSIIEDSLILTVKGAEGTPAGPYFSLHLNKIVRQFEGWQLCESPSWLGETMFYTDRKAVFLNYAGDSIYLDLDIETGQERVMQSTSNGIFTVSLESYEEETILGYEDSVKTLSIQFRELTGAPAEHPFNGKTIRLGKNLGFLKVYDFYKFPSDTVQKVLVGKTSPDIGISDIKYSDVFNFSAGDELDFEGEHSTTITSKEEWWIKYTFLDNTNRIAESFRRYSNFSDVTETYSKDTINNFISYYHNSLNLDNYSLQISEPGVMLLIIENGELVKKSMGYYGFVEGGCLEEIIVGGYIPSEEFFKPGLARVLECCGSDYEKLVYYKKGDVESGEPIHMGVITSILQNSETAESKIFPNPAADFLSLRAKGNAEVKIFNPVGNIVLSTIIDGNEKIDIEALVPGIYQVVVKENGRQYQEKLIIK